MWYLCAFDLVNLLASLLGLDSSGGTAAGGSEAGASSAVDVRRSPKHTIHDSAMLRGLFEECNEGVEPHRSEFGEFEVK